MLNAHSFWEEEESASLLTSDHGYLQKQLCEDGYASLFALASTWLDSAGVSKSDIEAEAKVWEEHLNGWGDSEFERIHLHDAQRVFRAVESQERLAHVLTIIQGRIGDYHQAMSLVGGFLLLTLEPPAVVALLHEITTSTRYLKGYWKSESIACATDGYVLHELTSSVDGLQEVSQHLESLCMLPETYVQKWYNALAVHVLPFEALFVFFSQFFEHGFSFLFRFSMSLLTQLRGNILESSSQAQLYALLRLDQEHHDVNDALALTIVSKDNTELYMLSVGEADFEFMRLSMFEKHLKARVESARVAHAEGKAAADSLSTCELCQENPGAYWCVECAKFICDDCPPTLGHDEDEHMVVDAEDKDADWIQEALAEADNQDSD